MPEFMVVFRCSDCDGDPMGCNGGKPWTLGGFGTEEEATNAGWSEVEDCGPWDFEVVPREGTAE